MMRQLCLGSPWRITGLPRSTCDPWRIPQQSKWMHKGVCPSKGRPCWSRLLTGAVAPRREKPVLEQVFQQYLCGPMGAHTLEALYLVEEPMVEQFLKNCKPCEGLTLENSLP